MNEKNRRRLRDILISPLKQIRFCMHLIVVNVSFAVCASGAFYYFINEYYNVFFNLLKLFNFSEEAKQGIIQQTTHIQMMAIFILACFGVLFVVITTIILLRFTHHIYGPLFQINSVLERFAAGETSLRINLRKNDDVQKTADLLNRLFQQVEDSQRNDSSAS